MSISVGACFEGSVTLVSASPRGEDSQDRGSAFGAAGYGAVVVCDGVGSYPRSGDVAELACRLAEGHVRKSDGVGGIADLPGVLEATLADVGIGATTVLALAADRSGDVGYCLVGNGLAIEAQAVRVDEERVRMCFTELALPQISFAAGRPTLASFLPWPGPGPVPCCVGTRRLTPDRMRLFLICSDGIGSEEERPLGRGPDGSLWRQVEPPLVALLEAVAGQWQTLQECAEPERLLERTLGAALVRLLDDGMLDDDATVGALLMRPDDVGEAA